ncbi:MAG: type VII secretion protein EssC [Bacilli bacterium]
MKLYLANEIKLSSYNLPEKPEESFLFSYTSSITNIEVFFNVYSKDNNWYIKGNEDFIINGAVTDTLLEKYKFYTVKVKGVIETLYLYTYDTYNDNYKDILIDNIETLTIGSGSNNSILYANVITEQEHIKIYKENNSYYLEPNISSKANVYINNRIIKKKYYIEIGDIIFLNNLKLIWMGTFIRIYIPFDTVSFAQNLNIKEQEIINNDNYLNYDMKENNIALYKDGDYFFHKPRLSSSYQTEEVVIDSPTAKKEKDDIPLVFTLSAGATMVVSSVINLYNTYNKYAEGKTDKTQLIISIITAVSMIFFSFLLPKITNLYNKKANKRSDEYRAKKYQMYLEKKQAEIQKILTYEKQSLYDNSPSSKECYDFVVGIKNRLWEREITDFDFLSIRVGLGNINSSVEIKAPEEKFTLEEDELIERAISVSNSSKLLNNVPITVSLVENFVSAIICNFENQEKYLNGIILQLLSLHNPKDLKIVFLTDEENDYNWNYLKLTPHIYSDDKSMRYYATNEDEAKLVLKEIENIYNERKSEIKNSSNEINEEIEKEDLYKSFSPYYLIITDCHRKYSNIEFLNKIMSFNKNIGFSLLLISNSLKNLPNECRKYTYVTDKSSCVFEKDYSKNNQTNFTTEIFDNINMYKVAKELSSVPVQTLSEIYNLPNVIPFLEMFNVGNIEQLNILNKWASSNPIATLSCPVGISPSGELFKLDLHEKAHGPHGLVAGSTGSGKSEFIITYLLSMAICYHPDEVQFVLIDYKGGGLAGAFENKETGVRIPHLSGTITNLDVSEMNRTLISINSELKRRQQKFNEVRDKLGESTIDIYKYQKYYREGLIDTPIPHLFIVSDEFAELKSQQPEFMDELISTARIGRSLGVHLILATQKPSGVVNDQIWSNTRFRICLKVQTQSDSMEMLKRPEAASIKETGRFYLQVGYDELFELGQSAWAGAAYIPSEKVIKKVDDSISFIDNTGNVIKTANNISTTVAKASKGDQLTNIVKYLYDLANKNNLKRQQLWLDSIPEEIYLSNLLKKYNYLPKAYIIEPIIGEYDDPARQKQGLLKIDLTNTGNMLLYGIPGSGKENAISTMITSICTKHSTDEVNIYIIDFGAETLGKFKDFPQVGDVVYVDEVEKLNSLYSMIIKEMSKRKTLFAEYNGSYVNYIKQSEKKLPNIIIVIHQFETMVDNPLLLYEKFINLFKEGPKFGITFIVTNSLATGIRLKVLQLFPNKLTLKLGDDMDYRMVVDAPRGLLPRNFFGRGLVKLEETLEFQTAYVSKPEEVNIKIQEIAKSLKELKMKNAPKVPTMPEFLTVDKLVNSEYTLSNIPVGISKNKLSIVTYDFSDNYVPILSNNLTANIHFIYGLIELLKQIPNSKVRIIDVLKLYKNVQGVDIYNNDFDTIIKQIKLETLDDDNLKRTNIFIIIGLGAFKNNVPTKTQKHFNDVFEGLKNYKKNKFIIYDDYNSYKSLETESWFRSNVNTSSGIWLGENAANQYSIRMPNISLEERKLMFNQIGYVVKNSSHTIIRYIVDKEFENEK